MLKPRFELFGEKVDILSIEIKVFLALAYGLHSFLIVELLQLAHAIEHPACVMKIDECFPTNHAVLSDHYFDRITHLLGSWRS